MSNNKIYQSLAAAVTLAITLSITTVTLGGFSSLAHSSDSFIDALSNGKTKADFRLRLEDVDTAVNDATAMTLRSRLSYTTNSYNQLSATIEVEDVRSVLGVNSYSVPQTGFNTGQHAAIPDPEVTELDQAYIQYKDSLSHREIGPSGINPR